MGLAVKMKGCPLIDQEIASHSAGVVISEGLVWHSLMRNSQQVYGTEELQAFELLVLKTLDWDLNAVTPVLWRDLILELCSSSSFPHGNHKSENERFLMHLFGLLEFPAANAMAPESLGVTSLQNAYCSILDLVLQGAAM